MSVGLNLKPHTRTTRKYKWGDAVPKEKAKTTTQRQNSFREAKKASGFIEVTMWLESGTVEKIAEASSADGITKGQVIDRFFNRIQPEKKVVTL